MLKTQLDKYFQDSELQLIVKDVIGTANTVKIQADLLSAIDTYFSVSLDKMLFIESSIGVVFGFLLSDGARVVLKVFSPKLSLQYLEEMNRVQTIFSEAQFPAPAVLSSIFKWGQTHAGFYAYIEGEKEDAHQSNIRFELAKALARFSDIVDEHHLKPTDNSFHLASNKRLWPIPHNALFDLKRTTRGAGWIAEKAQKARKILNSSSFVKRLAHTDWGCKNAVFQGGCLTGIFDWDSLGAMSETEMVGRAAAQFTADWKSGIKVTPTPEEGRLFVEAYAKCRHKKWTLEEYQIISASTDYLIATIARFEHARGHKEIHPYQDLLRARKDTSFLF